jgi:hypothetical protein
MRRLAGSNCEVGRANIWTRQGAVEDMPGSVPRIPQLRRKGSARPSWAMPPIMALLRGAAGAVEGDDLAGDAVGEDVDSPQALDTTASAINTTAKLPPAAR